MQLYNFSVRLYWEWIEIVGRINKKKNYVSFVHFACSKIERYPYRQIIIICDNRPKWAVLVNIVGVCNVLEFRNKHTFRMFQIRLICQMEVHLSKTTWAAVTTVSLHQRLLPKTISFPLVLLLLLFIVFQALTDISVILCTKINVKNFSVYNTV